MEATTGDDYFKVRAYEILGCPKTLNGGKVMNIDALSMTRQKLVILKNKTVFATLLLKLKEDTFERYTTLIFLHHFDCHCHLLHTKEIYDAIESNSNLRTKSKIFIGCHGISVDVNSDYPIISISNKEIPRTITFEDILKSYEAQLYPTSTANGGANINDNRILAKDLKYFREEYEQIRDILKGGSTKNDKRIKKSTNLKKKPPKNDPKTKKQKKMNQMDLSIIFKRLLLLRTERDNDAYNFKLEDYLGSLPQMDFCVVLDFIYMEMASDIDRHKFLRNILFHCQRDKPLWVSSRSFSEEEELRLRHNRRSLYTDRGVKVYCKTTSYAEFYAFGINPSLAIVLNHSTFANSRPGAIYDLKDLHKVLTEKRIHHALLNDGDLDQIEIISAQLRSGNFWGIRNLYLVINSHGREGDIILTSDTEFYDLKEMIIKPIQANLSLSRSKKFILVNACRGDKDPTGADYEDYERSHDDVFEKSDIEYLDDKIVIIYSAVKGFRSFRNNDDGAQFLKMFCEEFKGEFKKRLVPEVLTKVNERMGKYNEDWLKPIQHAQMVALKKNPKFKMKQKNGLNLRTTFNELDAFFNIDHFDESIAIERNKILTQQIIVKTDDD